tara:strand:+ start:2994 stop:5156 length:2163 start_codon:yes stop_codon:yes gene_type:complete
MPLNLASPGLVVREVDLTIGRVDTATTKAAGIVAPFQKGPVNEPTTIENEQDLIDTFGEPLDIDKHYEYWLTASSYLSYGGILSVVRSDDSDLANATDDGSPEIKILSTQDYNNKGYDLNALSNTVVAARNPGSWANDIKVCIIDGKADQIVTAGITTLTVGAGVTQAVPSGTVLPGAGTTSLLDGYFKGIITEVNSSAIGVKFVSHVSNAGIETTKDYQPGGVYKFGAGVISFGMSANTGGGSTTTAATPLDWFDQQKITLSNSTINWNTIAERPGTSSYATARSSRFDEVHVVVIDDKGTVTGNAGTVLEKHLGLSKAKDAEFSAGSPSYWRKYIYNNSSNIFGMGGPTLASSGITTTAFVAGGFTKQTDVAWDQDAQGISFAGSGVLTKTLTGGENYNGAATLTAGAMSASLGGITAGYDLFENKEEFDIDFLLMGSANYPQADAQALANKLISIAELRKDVVAFISPNRGAFLNDSAVGTGTLNSAADMTSNVVGFYAPLTSSSYAVFDSGYKYMFDRFSDTFRYIPLNGDIGGTCARNDINNFPWFSPAGTARGGILNAVKLAYTPNQTQRDVLYGNRINPVIFSPGAGIILFGDKTGFGKASAFDRINVRRLFIFIEEAISAAARDQLFEFNDEITRTNFVNIVEPFLRDVQSKRGIFDFRVVCDETNNTAAIIDSNEFVADIFIKPARSINFIGLTFVATRTGISFDEVIGTV